MLPKKGKTCLTNGVSDFSFSNNLPAILPFLYQAARFGMFIWFPLAIPKGMAFFISCFPQDVFSNAA